MIASHLTPRTTLKWSTLQEWYACARRINDRRSTFLHHEQARLHVKALPIKLIYSCADRTTLSHCSSWLCNGPSDFMQPPRGKRGDAPHTPLIVAINNRIAQLDREADYASMDMGHNSRAAGLT